jgi:transcriptional regulator with XRE-family HTH domain
MLMNSDTDRLGIDRRDPGALARIAQAENAYAFVARLRDLREELGLTQREVAARMNRDPAVVSNIERLGADPRWSSLRRYASALGVVIEYDYVPEDVHFLAIGTKGIDDPDGQADDFDAADLRQAFAAR